MRRVMLWVLLALVLPTAALASPINFSTGTFKSGLVTGQNASLGWNTSVSAALFVTGSMFFIRIDFGPLSAGCAANGSCTWTGGLALVRDTSNVQIFRTSLVGGTINKQGNDVLITASFIPNMHGIGAAGGFVRFDVQLGEPGALGLLGTGLIGLAGLVRRKFKFWA